MAVFSLITIFDVLQNTDVFSRICRCSLVFSLYSCLYLFQRPIRCFLVVQMTTTFDEILKFILKSQISVELKIKKLKILKIFFIHCLL